MIKLSGIKWLSMKITYSMKTYYCHINANIKAILMWNQYIVVNAIIMSYLLKNFIWTITWRKKNQLYYNVYLLGIYVCQRYINFEMAIAMRKKKLGEWFPHTLIHLVWFECLAKTGHVALKFLVNFRMSCGLLIFTILNCMYRWYRLTNIFIFISN